MPASLDEVAEWLRRWTANPLGSARVGSNPILVEDCILVIDYVFVSLYKKIAQKQFARCGARTHDPGISRALDG